MEINVEYNKIPNGLDDVARYLGLDPEKTVFMHSTSFDEENPENIKRKAINKGRMLYAEVLSYSSNSKNGAKTAIAYYNSEMLNYYDEVGLLSLNNIIQLGEDRKIEYPYNSVSKMMNKRLKEDNEVRKSLEGYTIVSSYLSLEDKENAELIKGNLLMDIKDQERFNSKYEFRKMSEKYGFSIPEGVAFIGVAKLEEELKKLISKFDNSISIWIKLESQSSGTGNIFIENAANTKIEDIKNKVFEVGRKIYDEQYILNEMPLIIEVDVNSLYDEEEVENIGVEAVIADNKVTIIGGVSQATKNGAYLGNEMTEKTYKYLDIAQETAKDAFISMCKEGYRGFMTIDVLVTLRKETGEIKAYNIDPNARFSAGTMLLKNIHSAEMEHNQKIYGISYSNGIPTEGSVLNTIRNAAGEGFYNKDSKKLGFIPTLVNDVSIIGDNRYYLKSVVLDLSYEKALDNFNNFKSCFKTK